VFEQSAINGGAYTTWHKPIASTADYASGAVPVATPGSRNIMIIGKTDPIQTGLPDGTVVLRKQS